MATATITSKGQVTIPVEVRKKMGLKAGDRVHFVESTNGDFLLKAKKGSIEELRGMIKWKGKPLSIREMNKVIEEGWTSRFKRLNK